jgi:hypothetical protein
MKIIGFSAISAVLVIVAASSLISMIGLFQIDRIVNQDLYQYGLEFSYAWAMPYWTITKLIFATGWFNIIAAIAFHLYILTYGQKGTQQIEPQTEKETNKPEILETTKPINEEKTETETKPTEQTPQPQPEQAEQPKETQKVEEPKQPIATETPQPETETKPSETQQKSEEEPTKIQLPQEQEPPPTSVL